MIKPQVWFRGGTYTGKFDLRTTADWEAFEGGYRRFILQYARVADSLGADLLCIGTEWDRFVAVRPGFWQQLIAEIKTLYRGHAHLRCQLGYVRCFSALVAARLRRVDAYFPLVDAPTPTVEVLSKAWRPHLKALAAFHEKTGKPILFTEYGYRSADGATARPWEHHEAGTPNPTAQQRAYEALFAQVWSQPYVAGGFVWKWYEPRQLERRASRWHQMETDYSPQGQTRRNDAARGLPAARLRTLSHLANGYLLCRLPE
jgi:hypothetical protein